MIWVNQPADHDHTTADQYHFISLFGIVTLTWNSGVSEQRVKSITVKWKRMKTVNTKRHQRRVYPKYNEPPSAAAGYSADCAGI